MSVATTERVGAWNVVITESPSEPRIVAGAYQSRTHPFLTWKDFFDDLLFCFDLELVSASGRLALWFRSGDGALANETSPCVYIDHPESNSKFIKISSRPPTNNVNDELSERLRLTLVSHDESCVTSDLKLETHLQNGCAQPVKLSLNPRSLFLPIPTASKSTSVASTPATSSLLTSPARSAKRPRLDTSVQSDFSPQPKFTVPPELEHDVKQKYNSTCVITGIRTSWMPSQFGVGIENCNIVPKSMYAWYPWEDNDAHSQQDSWNAVNQISNCMAMDSTSHHLHDNRLLAIHPDSYKIRLFAPLEHLMKRNNQEAFFHDDPPDKVSLAWHYRMTVMENMGALRLQAIGGAKRIPWRQGPSAISVQKDQNNNQSADPEQVGAQPEQGTAPGVASSALFSRHYMVTSPLLDSPDDSDSEDSDDWQYRFTSELDNRLQNLVYV